MGAVVEIFTVTFVKTRSDLEIGHIMLIMYISGISIMPASA